MIPAPAHCQTRKRLTEVYLELVVRNAETGRRVHDMKSDAWRSAREETRRACQEALADLNEHRQEHGC
jgi:hypothetical protein